jgi:hypothetical protein
MNEKTRLDTIALTRQEHFKAQAAAEAVNALVAALSTGGHLSPNALAVAQAHSAEVDEQECAAWKAYMDALNAKPLEVVGSAEEVSTHPALAS